MIPTINPTRFTIKNAFKLAATSDSAEATETQSALIPVEADGVVDVRLQGRQLRLKIQGSLKNDFTVGATRLEQHAGGRR